MHTPPRPSYAELPDGNARGVFGDDDVLGCLNLLTAERAAAAARLVLTGESFGMDASLLDYNVPGFFGGTRRPPQHTIFKVGRSPRTGVQRGRDEFFDGLYTHAGSQWDGLTHCLESRGNTFYNHMSDPAEYADDGVRERAAIGIAAWAERGIVGRGVLLDLARWAELRGAPIDWRSAHAITAEDLEACADAQGVRVDEGTILLFRVGWQSGWQRLTAEERTALSQSKNKGAPGLEASSAMARRLWDWGVAAVASDNPALEVYPMADPQLHEDLLARFGMPIGELWLLDDLASACAREGRYEFLLVSAPMNVPGGVGSTANAVAIL